MPNTQVEVLMADLDGQQAKTSCYLAGIDSDMSAGDPATIVAAIQGISAAKVYACVGHVQDFDDIGSATANDYSAEDKLKVFGISDEGQYVEASIPAPLESIFGADKESVDLTAGAGATLKAALEAAWVGPDGSAVTVLAAERTRPTRKR
jgi:hypothetical protein